MTWHGSKGHFGGQGLLDTMTQITQMPPSLCLGDLSQPGLLLRTADMTGPTQGRLVSSEFSRFLGPVERSRKFLSEDGEDVAQEGQVLALWGQKGEKGAQMEAGRTRGAGRGCGGDTWSWNGCGGDGDPTSPKGVSLVLEGLRGGLPRTGERAGRLLCCLASGNFGILGRNFHLTLGA